jgi:VanZ family protein
MESTDYASASNTDSLLYSVLSFFFPHIPPYMVWELDLVLRKSGHFIGYGILSVLVFLALRNTYRDRIRPVLSRSWGIYLRDYWQWELAAIGILVTLITASFDEIHQTFLPSRTGRWQDVVIDTCGALLMQVFVCWLSLWALHRNKQRDLDHQPDMVSTR